MKNIDNIKIGDKVAYMHFSERYTDSFRIGWGYVGDITDQYIVIGRRQTGFIDFDRDSDNNTFFLLTDNNQETIKDDFLHVIDLQISKEEKNIKKLTNEEKNILVTNKFIELQDRINIVAQRLISAEDDSQWINRLKEICQLKKQIFSIKIQDLEDINKKNLQVRYKINQLKDFKETIKQKDFLN